MFLTDQDENGLIQRPVRKLKHSISSAIIALGHMVEFLEKAIITSAMIRKWTTVYIKAEVTNH